MIKRTVLQAGRTLGLFAAAQRRARGSLRILGYHGFEMGLERAFRPLLFIDPELFRRRILRLKDMGFEILGLGDAVERLRLGTLPPNPVVITIDDGFYGTYRYGRDLMRDLRVPMTIYVTSYYVTHENPIYGLAVQYMFWKTTATSVDLTGLGLPRTGVAALSDALRHEILTHGEQTLGEEGRVTLARALGERLGVSYEALEKSRALSLMTSQEIAEMVSAGFDVQLHTHRHRLPVDSAAVTQEIIDNRRVLEPLAGKKLVHFCYPGDTWQKAADHERPLAEAGIVSATSDAPGLATRDTSLLELPRFLDSGTLDELIFDAEMTGFLPGLRTLASQLRR